MKKVPFLLLAAAAFACANLNAQTPQTATNEFKYSGTVVDAAGNPVAGATVESDHLPPFETNRLTTVSGADGKFSFKLSAQPRHLLAKKAGLATGWRLVLSQAETEVKIVLTPPGTIAGVVLNESKQPVAGAEVYVMTAFEGEPQMIGNARTINFISGKLAREQFSARTDAAGRFRIENLPTNATATLAVDAPGRVFPLVEEGIPFEGSNIHAGDAEIKLVLEPAARIEGKLVAGNNNQPFPVSQLSLRPDNGRFAGDSPSAKSSADGAFTFEKVPAGSYRLRASFPTNEVGLVAETVPVTLTPGQTLRDLQVKLVPGSLLELTVLDNNRKPQKANFAVFADESVQYNGTTDSNGLAKIFVLPGDYRVSAYQQRMNGQTSTSVTAGTTNRLEIEVVENISSGGGPAIKVTGILRQPDGKPAANVPVQIIGTYREDTPSKTDAEGKFAFQWTPNQGGNEQQECLLARDLEHNLAVAQDLDEETTNVDLTLAPGLTLFGRVLSENKPVTNVNAILVFWRGNSGRWMRDFAITNTPGQYEIPALPPGRKYGVILSAPGFGQQQNHTLEISADPGRQELEAVELRPANMKIAGQVLDEDDKPVARCYVNLSGNNQPSGNARTDSEGRFRFNNVCEGTVRLSANTQRFYGSVSAEAGDTNIVLRLGQRLSSSSDAITHNLRGVVTDEGKPATNAQLAVFPNNGARWFKTGTNGEYKLTWSLESWQVQNGSPLLVFRDKSRNLAGTEEIPDETTNLNVTLKPALTISGQVKNSDGAPLAASQITLWLKAGNSYQSLDQNSTIPVNAEGRFELKCLPLDAPYMVSASAKGYGRVQQQLVPEYETNHLELAFTLNRADRIIAGQILGNDDKPASGVNVQISGDGQPEGSITTDSKGRFQFKVCEGQVRLFAYSQNGNGSAQGTVEAGDTNIVLNLSSSSGAIRESPRRPSLKGSPLPDLTEVNLTAPAGKPLLICLFDAAQRPSRRAIQVLSQQTAALQNKNISLAAIQSTTISDEAFDEWKNSASISFPIGRVPAKSDKVKWASSVGALPWLILTDANHRVVAEGFAIGDLDTQLQSLPK